MKTIYVYNLNISRVIKPCIQSIMDYPCIQSMHTISTSHEYQNHAILTSHEGSKPYHLDISISITRDRFVTGVFKDSPFPPPSLPLFFPPFPHSPLPPFQAFPSFLSGKWGLQHGLIYAPPAISIDLCLPSIPWFIFTNLSMDMPNIREDVEYKVYFTFSVIY